MKTKEIIIKAAGTIFKRFGFNKSSMADIALEARKGRRTIYTHFATKEEVFKAVIDKEVRALVKKLEKICKKEISPEEKLRAYMHARMGAVKELTVYYDALRQDMLNNMGIIENLREEYDATEVSLIQGILDEGNKKKLFAINDTRLIAEAVVIAAKCFELPIFMGRSGYDHRPLIDPLIEILYNGIKRHG